MNSATEIHGVQVEPMGWHPQKQDLVYHTHKHFLSREWRREWRRAEPREALAPADFVAKATKMGVKLQEWARTSMDGRWWRGKEGSLVRKAHDRGYAPRYLELIRRAGPIGRGGKWSRQPEHGPGRWKSEILGFKVAVDWKRQGDRAQVVTAMRLDCLREAPEAQARPLDAFDVFRRKCLARGSTGVSRSTPTPPQPQRGSRHE